MKRIFALILVLCMVVALAACGNTGTATKSEASAESDFAYIQGQGKLIVGITDFAPMDYKENGEWIGFDADLAKEFCKSIGVECQLVEIEWDSKELELQNKSIDCLWNGMTLTDGVKEAMATSKPYCNNAQIIVIKKDNASKVDNPDELAKLSIAVESGSAGMEAAQANGYNFVEVTSQANAVMEVASGTSDACIIDSLMAAAMVGEGTSYPDLTITKSLTSEEYGVGFRKGSDMAEKLNEFLKKAYDDGTIMKIAEKYGTQAAIIAQ